MGKNTGARKGHEVVQLYVSRLNPTVECGKSELNGFERITLQPKQTRTVTFNVKFTDLAYWNEEENKWVVEADQLKLAVGASSADLRLEKTSGIVFIE